MSALNLRLYILHSLVSAGRHRTGQQVREKISSLRQQRHQFVRSGSTLATRRALDWGADKCKRTDVLDTEQRPK